MWPIARWPSSGGERPLVEHLRDEAHVLDDGEVSPSLTAMPADSWPRCCSAYRPEVGEVGDRLARRVDAEHAAGLAGLAAVPLVLV